MITEPMCAFQVENNDFVAEDGEVKGYVYSTEDDGDHIVLDICDDDGEHTVWRVAPFDVVQVVTKFDDDEDWHDVLLFEA